MPADVGPSIENLNPDSEKDDHSQIIDPETIEI